MIFIGGLYTTYTGNLGTKNDAEKLEEFMHSYIKHYPYVHSYPVDVSYMIINNG